MANVLTIEPTDRIDTWITGGPGNPAAAVQYDRDVTGIEDTEEVVLRLDHPEGRRHAVVAEEIRKLATSAGDNAQTIGDALSDITNQIVAAANTSRESRQAFSEIESGIETGVSGLGEIASSIVELSSGGKEILTSASSLSDSGQTVRDGAQKIRTDAALIEASMSDITDISSSVVSGMQEIAAGTQQNRQSAQQVRDESEQHRRHVDGAFRDGAFRDGAFQWVRA